MRRRTRGLAFTIAFWLIAGALALRSIALHYADYSADDPCGGLPALQGDDC
jgi:hypothetical protein